LKEKSNAQGKGENEVGLNNAPITNDQIQADTGFNNQDTKQCVLYLLLPETAQRTLVPQPKSNPLLGSKPPK
jgi:hypothetical protein